MKTKIIKANANGNNFILIIVKDYLNKISISKKNVKYFCSLYKTDGFIVLRPKSKTKILMDYFNNDGSWETLCLNGLTCSTKVLKKQDIIGINTIECGGINYLVNQVDNELIKITMPKPRYKTKKIIIDGIEGYFIDSGAKHFVIEQKNKWPKNSDLIKSAKIIRYNTTFFPNGVNVNFFKVINQSTIEVKTYEKGIEKLMQSCASGSFACAFHYHYNSKKNKDYISIINSGGKMQAIFNKNYTSNFILNKATIDFIKLINYKDLI